MSRSHFRLLSRIVCGTVIASCVAIAPQTSQADEDQEYYELMKTFADTFEQIDRNYVKSVNRRELLEAAIRGMTSKLDPYSNYISPDDLARFTQSVEQEFGGIGIQVQVDPQSRRLTVIAPLPGTPAYREGIRSGDMIVEIEGQATEGYTTEDAVKLLKGEAGKAVNLGIQRPGTEETIRMSIVREIIQVPTVLGDSYNPDNTWNFLLDPETKVGYIRLTHFSRHSAPELVKALKDLTAQGMKALVLDLRFNPGGLLSQAIEISDMFIESGKIVSTKGRNSSDREWTAKKEGTYTGFPMAVLVNRYSASASEIVSACLQDHKRAVVIGERSWGKGSVQNVIELEAGNSALKLTTASYHRPSGKNIHRFPGATDKDEWGVYPDDKFLIDFTPQEIEQYLIYRRDRDVYKADGPPKSEYVDRQLQSAVDFLKQAIAGTTPAPNDAADDSVEAVKPKAAAAAGALPRKIRDAAIYLPEEDTEADENAAAVFANLPQSA
ncbi:MAG: S41 family peptidase [Planctomycetaceae bacterium]